MSETFYAIMKCRVDPSVLAFHAHDRECRTDLWDRCICYTANPGQGHKGVGENGRPWTGHQFKTRLHTHTHTHTCIYKLAWEQMVFRLVQQTGSPAGKAHQQNQ